MGVEAQEVGGRIGVGGGSCFVDLELLALFHLLRSDQHQRVEMYKEHSPGIFSL